MSGYIPDDETWIPGPKKRNDARSHADEFCSCGHKGGVHWDFGTNACSAIHCDCASFVIMEGAR